MQKVFTWPRQLRCFGFSLGHFAYPLHRLACATVPEHRDFSHDADGDLFGAFRLKFQPYRCTNALQLNACQAVLLTECLRRQRPTAATAN